MNCKKCGAPSGKYQLCKKCYDAQQQISSTNPISDDYIYEPRYRLLSKSEESYFAAIKAVLPTGFLTFPQINLATFINRTDDAHFHNELFRNVDFLITDSEYRPRLVIEINDQSHSEMSRKLRDNKVHNILEEAGIPFITFWTSYGINPSYMETKISASLNSTPIRIKHSVEAGSSLSIVHDKSAIQPNTNYRPMSRKNGCYIATCVYGSYDCPEVWVLRRYRDFKLSSNCFGKLFIKFYYSISPTIVRIFGSTLLFHKFWRRILNKKVSNLVKAGYSSLPYNDK